MTDGRPRNRVATARLRRLPLPFTPCLLCPLRVPRAMEAQTPEDTAPAAYPRRTLEAFLARAAEEEDHLRQAITSAQHRAHAATASPGPNGATAHVSTLLEDLSLEFATRRREVEGQIELLLTNAHDSAARILEQARADAQRLLDHLKTDEQLAEPTNDTVATTEERGAVPIPGSDPTGDLTPGSDPNQSDEGPVTSPLHGLRLAFVTQPSAEQTDDRSVAWRWTP